MGVGGEHRFQGVVGSSVRPQHVVDGEEDGEHCLCGGPAGDFLVGVAWEESIVHLRDEVVVWLIGIEVAVDDGAADGEVVG